MLLHNTHTVRNSRDDCRQALTCYPLTPFRSEKSNPGFHESLFCSLQALRDKEFSIFDDTMRQARYFTHSDTAEG